MLASLQVPVFFSEMAVCFIIPLVLSDVGPTEDAHVYAHTYIVTCLLQNTTLAMNSLGSGGPLIFDLSYYRYINSKEMRGFAMSLPFVNS